MQTGLRSQHKEGCQFSSKIIPLFEIIRKNTPRLGIGTNFSTYYDGYLQWWRRLEFNGREHCSVDQFLNKFYTSISALGGIVMISLNKAAVFTSLTLKQCSVLKSCLCGSYNASYLPYSLFRIKPTSFYWSWENPSINDQVGLYIQ